MQISPLTTNIQSDGLSAEQLAGNESLTETEKVGQLSRQFEALLLRQILNQSFKTVIKSSLNEESAVSGIYQDMVTNQMAESISHSGSFGLAQSLEKEMSRQLTATTEATK